MNNEMNRDIDRALKQHYAAARADKCPPSMKKSLYENIGLSQQRSWQPARWAAVGLSTVLVVSMMFTYQQKSRQHELAQAQADLEIAMHYMNRVSLKSITSVNRNGLTPGLIKPLAKSVATL